MTNKNGTPVSSSLHHQQCYPIPNSLPIPKMNIKPDFDFDKYRIGVEDIKTEVGQHLKKAAESKTYRTLKDLLKIEGTEQPKLLNPFFPKVGLVGIIGSSDTGKSCLARQLCLNIIEDRKDFLGFPLNTGHKQAIYVTTEDDESSTSFAYKRMLSQEQCSNDEGLRFVFEQEKLTEQLDNLLTEQPVDIVVIDAYLDIAPPDSNQASQTRQVLHQYRTIANKHETLILFVHHTGKAARNLGPSKHGAVGSQSWEAKLRTVIELRSDTREPNKKHLCVVKGNNISQEYKNSSFLLEFNEDTLTFSDTGERIAFEDLAVDANPNSGGKKAFDVSEIEEDQHKAWIKAVFGDEATLKRKQLVERLKSITGRGDTAIEKGPGGMITYYLERGWIEKEGFGMYLLPSPF